MQKLHHYRINGTITLLSGTRIGGSDEQLEIGGIDLTYIKDPCSNEPYLPGSSLKGKMRSSLEKRFDKCGGNRPCGCKQEDCPVCRIFGPHTTDHDLGPTRIKVADARLMGNDPGSEVKSSTAIDRRTGSALRGSLRTDERLCHGAQFALLIDFEVYDIDKDFAPRDGKGKPIRDLDDKVPTGKHAMLQIINLGIEELEMNGIGAGTGKGYGRIQIETDDVIEITPRRRLRFHDSRTGADT